MSEKFRNQEECESFLEKALEGIILKLDDTARYSVLCHRTSTVFK